MTAPTRILGTPGLYVQGPGAIDRLPEIVATLGRRALFVSDRWVEAAFAPRLRALFDAHGAASFDAAAIDGELTPAAVDRLDEAWRGRAVDVVIAAGGGKGVDAGKAVAHRLGARLVTFPTACSNDGPTSRVFLLYDDDHRLRSVERLARNPDAVVVDTAVLAAAPPALLVSGIGDALVKRYEAEQAMRAGAPNLFGGAATIAAARLARTCDTVLRRRAVAALAAARAGTPDADFEAVVEACILLAGIGFEGTGLSIAHSMTRGLTAVPATAAALHGRQVAWGLLVQFVLERRPPGFVARQLAFHEAVGLPTGLADLGLAEPADAQVATIAELSARAPHARNFPRPPDAHAIADAMRRLERLRAARLALDHDNTNNDEETPP